MTHSQKQIVEDFVRAQLAERLKIAPEAISADSDLIELGLQSIDAVLLCGIVEDHFQVELDPSTIFQHDTVGSFVDEIASRLDAQ